MYPRQPNFSHDNASASSRSRTQSKRDQIARLLINKFRNNFAVNSQTELQLDTLISEAVYAMVKTDESLTEKQLQQLNRSLQKTVRDYRANVTAQQQQDKDTDQRSFTVTSSAPVPANVQHNRSQSSNLFRKSGNLKPAEKTYTNIIKAMTSNKGVGMSEDEWNSIVLRNAQKAREEQEARKVKMLQQREQMKNELHLQVVNRKEAEQQRKLKDRQFFNDKFEQDQRKRADEEAKKQKLKESEAGAGKDLLAQLLQVQERQHKDVLQRKQSELAERDRIEKSIREAEDKEKRDRAEKRQKLISLTEVDRREKREHQRHLKTLQPVEAEHNLVSQFFNRPQHKAYDYRAKQEEIQSKIGQQFLSPWNQINFANEQTADFEAAARERNAQRKVKELETKRAQDLQVEAKVAERERVKQQQREYRDAVISDAKRQASEDKEKAQLKIERNLKNQNDIRAQISERSKLLQLIGGKVVRNATH